MMNLIRLIFVKIICLSASVLFPVIAQAEMKDLTQEAPFRLAINYLGDAKVSDSRDTSGTEISVREIELKGVVGAADMFQGKLITGIDVRNTQYQYTKNTHSRDLYEVALPLTYVTGSEKWTHIARLAPSLNSDLTEVTEDDLTTSFLYQGRYRSSDRLTWVLGAGGNHYFGDYKMYPLLGVVYQMTDRIKLDVLVPKFQLSFSSHHQLSYISLTPAGRKWNIESEDNSADVNIVTKEMRVALGHLYDFSGLSLRAEVGKAFGRVLDLEQGSNQIDVNVDNASFASIALEYRL